MLEDIIYGFLTYHEERKSGKSTRYQRKRASINNAQLSNISYLHLGIRDCYKIMIWVNLAGGRCVVRENTTHDVIFSYSIAS